MRRAKPLAHRLSWRQAMTLDWIARGSLSSNKGDFAKSGSTIRSIWRSGLIEYPWSSKGGQALTPLGFRVVVILRRERKV